MKEKTNKIIYQDDVITIIELLSLKYGNQKCIIDTEDYDKIKDYNWCIHKGYKNKYFYAVSPIRINNKRTQIKLHRIIINAKEKQCIDHVNFNGLDNRKLNLRICNNAENVWHKLVSCKNKSGYKGVCWNKKNKKWKSQITFNYKYIFLGYYSKKIEVAKVYNNKAKELFGEFAILNQV